MLDGMRRALLALALLVQTAVALAGVDIDQMRVERQDAGLFLHVHLKLDIGPAVEEALTKGVAVYFVAEAELMRCLLYTSPSPRD